MPKLFFKNRWNLRFKVTKINLAAGFLPHNAPSEFQFWPSFSHQKARTKFAGHTVGVEL